MKEYTDISDFVECFKIHTEIMQAKIDEQAKDIKILRVLLKGALEAFKCTEKLDDYPESDWANQADKILKIKND